MLSKSFFLLALFAVICPSAALAQVNSATGAAKTIEVTGHGEAAAKPDTMTVSFSVDSEEKSADECTRLESEKANRVVDALKAKIGAQAKIQTSDFSLNQQMGYGPAAAATPQPPPATWRFNGQVTINYPTLDDMGEFISAGLAAGANGIQGSGFEELSEGPPRYLNQNAVGAATSGAWSPGPTKRVAFVVLTVQADGTSPEGTMRRGAATAHKVEAAVKEKMRGQGTVELSEFQLQQLNENMVRQVYQPQPTVPQVQGYTAHATVSAETHNLQALGEIIEAAMKAGATQLSQVTFSLSEDSDARKQAIEKAAAEAKLKASTLASSMGIKLGSVIHLSTNAQSRPQVIYGNAFQRSSLGRMSLGAASSMPVLPHEVGYYADVTAVYQIE